MEKIQSHELVDVYRVRDGLLVVVNKYESLGYSLYGRKGKTKGVRGCKGLKILLEDCTDTYYKKTYPKDTYLLHDYPVKPITDYTKFKVEIKSSGGAIEGSISDIEVVLGVIEDIMDGYK